MPVHGEQSTMSENPILDAVFHSWNIQVIWTACRLGVFTRVEDEALGVEELTRDLHCDRRLLQALLEACVAMGLLHRVGGGYRNAHCSSAYLVEGRPMYLGHILEVQASGATRWAGLYETVRTGEAAPAAGEIGEGEPRFTLAMNDLGTHAEAAALAASVDLSDARHLVDIGCGSGLYSITLCRHFPRLRATLVDRQTVLETTAKLVAGSGVADRIALRPGDMTRGPLGLDADVALLSDSLYYEPGESMGVLRAVHDALRPGGTLILRGYYADPEGSESEFGAIFRVHLLLCEPARTPPTAADLVRMMSETGFENIRRFALTARSTCLLATR
jgi:hypothetical protein